MFSSVLCLLLAFFAIFSCIPQPIISETYRTTLVKDVLKYNGHSTYDHFVIHGIHENVFELGWAYSLLTSHHAEGPCCKNTTGTHKITSLLRHDLGIYCSAQGIIMLRTKPFSFAYTL